MLLMNAARVSQPANTTSFRIRFFELWQLKDQRPVTLSKVSPQSKNTSLGLIVAGAEK